MLFKNRIGERHSLKAVIAGTALVLSVALPAEAGVITFEELLPLANAEPSINAGDNFTLFDLSTAPYDTAFGGRYRTFNELLPEAFTIRALGDAGGAGPGPGGPVNELFSVFGSVEGGGQFVGVGGNDVVVFNDAKNGDGRSELTRTDGGLFDIFSIDLAPLVVGQGAVVEFVGPKADNSTVTKSFNVTSTFELQAKDFEPADDFVNLVSLVWTNEAGAFHQFDNINVANAQDQGGGNQGGGNNEVPEPGALSILAVGLLGLGLLARRRQRTIL